MSSQSVKKLEDFNPFDMADKAGEAEALLSMLSNKNRLMILCKLVMGEQSVGALEQDSGLSQSALSQHLAKLRSSKIVGTRREGQTIYYSIKSKEAEAVLQTLYDLYCA